MKNFSPRTRSLLRQANRIAASGKRAAAENLYRQIIKEAPETAPAWVGLAQVIQDQAEQETALEQALEIDPENERATIGLTALRNGQSVIEALQPEPEPEPEPDPEQEAAAQPERDWQEPVTKEARFDSVQAPTEQPAPEMVEDPLKAAEQGHETHLEGVVVKEEALTCANHPNRLTFLRCNKCGKPICSRCARPTPVGYRCKECIREHEAAFFSASLLDYLIAVVVGYPLGVIAGYFVSLFTGGIFGFFVIFYAAFVGSVVARIVHRAVGRRRGRWMPHLVGSAVVFGGVIPALLALLFGGFSFQLIFLGLYIVIASSAAFYQMR